MRFARHDFESVLDFVRDLYSHHGLDDCAERAMGSLREIVGAERIIYGNFDVERQAATLRMQPSIVTEQDGTVDGAVNGICRSSAVTIEGVSRGARRLNQCPFTA
jgi:hypothetical protein